jgi:hypothetical protein
LHLRQGDFRVPATRITMNCFVYGLFVEHVVFEHIR